VEDRQPLLSQPPRESKRLSLSANPKHHREKIIAKNTKEEEAKRLKKEEYQRQREELFRRPEDEISEEEQQRLVQDELRRKQIEKAQKLEEERSHRELDRLLQEDTKVHSHNLYLESTFLFLTPILYFFTNFH
jgi:hypothetical protein